MDIGIFSKTFARPTLGAVLDAVAGYGVHAVQFNMSCAGVSWTTSKSQTQPTIQWLSK